ncbi:hypothetical protein BH23VER1_BH23VER1_07770 [soil metagenome]
MESHQVIRNAFKKTGPKEIAAELGLSLSLVYKWAQPATETGSGSRNPLDRVTKLMEMTGDKRMIQWLCEQQDGFFLRNPVSHCKEGYQVMPSTNAIVQRFAGLLTVITQAALDNEITPDESKKIRQVWDSLKSFTEGFVRCCEEGDFQELSEVMECAAEKAESAPER